MQPDKTIKETFDIAMHEKKLDINNDPLLSLFSCQNKQHARA